MSKSITVLSLGAGVQSTTLLLMAEHGEIERPVEAVFADTGWEPPHVYTHLDWLETQTSIPVTRVSVGNLRDDALAGKPEAWMPMHTVNDDGKKSLLRRQCTSNYKIRPIRRRIRELMRDHKATTARQLMGISLDELMRMRDSGVKYLTNVYPLVDRRMTRTACIRWLLDHGYPIPPKSSCIGCPYHDDAYWRDMRDNRPEEWSDAVDFDGQMRTVQAGRGTMYLHRQGVPLHLVDLSTPQDRGQLSFLDECEGMCGV